MLSTYIFKTNMPTNLPTSALCFIFEKLKIHTMKTSFFLSLRLATCLLSLPACQDQKKEALEKVSTVACQDAKDMIEAHVNDIIPLVGKLILNNVVKDELKNGAICDCLLPVVKKHMTEYTEADLDAMLVDKPKRSKAIKKAISQNSSEIFACYESKGLKGVKLIKNFIEKIIK